MDKKLERIELNLQKQVRLACGELVKSITKELHTLEEPAARLHELEVQQQRDAQPSCNIQEHISKLEDYEDLQKQHRLTLESCELLRSQNVRLQAQIKDLLAKNTDLEARSEPRNEPGSGNGSLWQMDSRQISDKTRDMIRDHPELNAVMSSHMQSYTKLQQAHSVLLGKLREHQEVIIQFQQRQKNPSMIGEDDGIRMAQLKSIIGSTTRSSHSPASSARVSVTSPVRSKMPSAAPEKPVDQVQEREVQIQQDAIVIYSSPPEQVEAEEARKPTEEAMTTDQVTTPAAVIMESQPEFISERPVKRRRIGKSNEVDRINKLIKMERNATDNESAADDPASIDLDAIHAPIILNGRRSEEVRRRLSPIDAAGADATQRHSEPPGNISRVPATNIISSAPIQNTNDYILVKNEPGNQYADAEEESFSPPVSVLSKWNAYVSGTPNRPALQPKTPNSRILNQRDKSVLQAGLNLRKENIHPGGVVESGIEAYTTPATDLARKSLSTNKFLANPSTPDFRQQPQGALQASKKRTPLIRKPENLNVRLRDKPVGTISLNDFRLNPAINQGFNQTLGIFIPDKESRNCLPECSKPECCGSALATAIRKAGIVSLQDLSNSEQSRLLRSYLGFPVSDLGKLTSQAYQKLLGEAIGKQFAEKYGRQQQSRVNSPPGYWRVEFPNTQEQSLDRREADEIEKATIADRRREALKGNGLWLFRDE